MEEKPAVEGLAKLQKLSEAKAPGAPPVAVKALSLVVTDQKTADLAGEYIQALSALEAKIHEDLDGPVKDAFSLHRKLTGLRKKHLEPIEKAIQSLRSTLSEWVAQEKAKREAEASQKRLNGGASEDDVAKLVAQLVARGMDEENANKFAKATLDEPASHKPEPVEVEGLAFPDHWHGEVTEPMEVLKQIIAGVLPLGIIEFKQAEINSLAKQHRGTRTFPGLRFYNKPQVRRNG